MRASVFGTGHWLPARAADKNPIRGLSENSVSSDRPNLRCDLGSGAASRCVPSTRATSRMRVSMVHRIFFISLSHVVKFHHERRRRPRTPQHPPNNEELGLSIWSKSRNLEDMIF